MAPIDPSRMANPPNPRTSLSDDGQSKRPRDARVIHTILAGQGIVAYQERVPLQILDFAYRHTSSILSDALHLSSDAYISQQNRAREGGPPPGAVGVKDADGQVSIAAIKLAIESRQQYQFNVERGGLARPFLQQLAEERNKVQLPKVNPNEWGVRLPAEKYVLTGVPWGLKEEWEEVGNMEEMGDTVMGNGVDAAATAATAAMDEEEGMEGGEEGEGRLEDIFGEAVDKDVDME